MGEISQVFAFGSVPLGTYIPDGDIDLTILCYNDEEEAFAVEICKFLENRRRDPDFQIKDILYINAQVNLYFLFDYLKNDELFHLSSLRYMSFLSVCCCFFHLLLFWVLHSLSFGT